MSDFDLSLGGVFFDAFEIPDTIRGGGAQRIATHRYPGGDRTVDAFGPDDAPIRFEGLFLDGDAEDRCQQIDAMRVAGEQVTLRWSSFTYQVVIREFLWEQEKFYRIRYALVLEVVEDEVQAAPEEGFDLESIMQGDVDDIADYQDALDGFDGGLDGLLTGITDTVATVASITGASLGFISTLSGQLQGCMDYLDPLIVMEDLVLDGLPDLPGGIAADIVESTLLSAGVASDACANFVGLRYSLGRLQRNVLSVAA